MLHLALIVAETREAPDQPRQKSVTSLRMTAAPILAIDFDLKSACVNALRWDMTGSNTPATAVRVVEQAGSRWVGPVNRLFESRGRIVRAR